MTKHLPRDQFACSVLTFYTGESSAKLLEQFDCPVYHWRLEKMYGWREFQVAKRLFRFVRDEKIDIVHTFFHTSDLWAGPIARVAGAKVHISSRRDMGVFRRKRHHIGYRLLRRFVDQIQTVSEGVRRYTLQADGADPKRTVTIYNGIESDSPISEAAVEEVRRDYDLPPGCPTILVTANLRPVKGLDLLIRAAAIVAKEMPGARFLVAGSFGGAQQEPYVQQLVELCESLGVSHVVRLLGQSQHIPELLSLSALYVSPSRSEGFSNALLEAMRAGLPCVATAVGGNVEAVVDGETGFLVPPEDPGELAKSILTLLRDPELRHSMGQAGRERFLRCFTVGTMMTKLVAAYLDVLPQKRGAPHEKQAAQPGRCGKSTSPNSSFFSAS
jgi:glycosyltransferase involved in cell wall biosynthesis